MFERAVYSYHAGDFTMANELFGGIRGSRKSDKPVEIYRRRCRLALHLEPEGDELDLEIPLEGNL